MKNFRLLAALCLALPLAAVAQTKPATTSTTKSTTSTAPATQQQTEVTEDLDPVTGKVIRRTTRTINVPVGTTVNTPVSTADAGTQAASDAQISTFLRRKTTVATLTAPALLNAYELFIERMRNDRQTWNTADWTAAAAVMSSLNSRYEDLRTTFSLDDKLTIRSQQGEFQALRTAKQISKQVSDKL
mgnify:CR=1 FL=1|jgi:hypothetical protein